MKFVRMNNLDPDPYILFADPKHRFVTSHNLSLSLSLSLSFFLPFSLSLFFSLHQGYIFSIQLDNCMFNCMGYINNLEVVCPNCNLRIQKKNLTQHMK